MRDEKYHSKYNPYGQPHRIFLFTEEDPPPPPLMSLKKIDRRIIFLET